MTPTKLSSDLLTLLVYYYSSYSSREKLYCLLRRWRTSTDRPTSIKAASITCADPSVKMALPSSVTLEVPCSDREFNVFKQNAESVKAVEIHIKRNSTISRWPREWDGKRDKEWMGCRHPMVHVHRVMQMNNRWELITFDWSKQPHFFSIGEKLHSRDISLALSYCRSSLKSVAFNNLRIYGTRTEIAELSKELAYAKDSIAFTNVIDDSEEMKLLMWACIETRSVTLKNCPWADENLTALNLSSCLEELHIYSIRQRHLDGIVGYLRYGGWPCDSRHGLKRLKI